MILIRWHLPEQQEALERRKQYHHPELLDMSAETVATTHGKGLMMDIVALKDLKKGEEVFNYISAADYIAAHGGEPFRIQSEQETNPYPGSVETFCFYNNFVDDDEVSVTQQMKYFSWDEEQVNGCFRPCTIMGRYSSEASDTPLLYTVLLLPEHNPRVVDFCVIEFPLVVSNVPSYAIRIVDRPYTTDVLMKDAFRHLSRDTCNCLLSVLHSKNRNLERGLSKVLIFVRFKVANPAVQIVIGGSNYCC